MKRLVIITTILAPMVGCNAGQRAREVALHTLSARDNGIERDVRMGIELIEAQDDDNSFDHAAAYIITDDFFEATSSKNRWLITTVAVPLWPTIESYAEDGYWIRFDAGDLGEGVVLSKTTRLNEFSELLTKVGGR